MWEMIFNLAALRHKAVMGPGPRSTEAAQRRSCGPHRSLVPRQRLQGFRRAQKMCRYLCLDEASLIPFADDPQVARRVELATGKQVKAVAIQTHNGCSRCRGTRLRCGPQDRLRGLLRRDAAPSPSQPRASAAATTVILGGPQPRSRGIRLCNCKARKLASKAKVSGSFRPLVFFHSQSFLPGSNTREILP